MTCPGEDSPQKTKFRKIDLDLLDYVQWRPSPPGAMKHASPPIFAKKSLSRQMPIMPQEGNQLWLIDI